MPHLKGLRYTKDGTRTLGYGCTSSIFQDVMKSDNLLHKQGFVDSFSQTTVTLLDKKFEPYNNEIPELLV